MFDSNHTFVESTKKGLMLFIFIESCFVTRKALKAAVYSAIKITKPNEIFIS